MSIRKSKKDEEGFIHIRIKFSSRVNPTNMNTYLRVYNTFHPQLANCKKQEDISVFGHKDTDYAVFMAVRAYHKIKVDKKRAAEDLKGTMEALDNGTLLGPISEGMDVCSNEGLNRIQDKYMLENKSEQDYERVY